jgi:hypothetical protein
VPVLIRSMVHPCGACQLLYTADTTIPPMHPPASPPRCKLHIELLAFKHPHTPSPTQA